VTTKSYRGSCHCGEVRFEVDLDLAAGTSRCNCSLCAKTRLWKAFVGADAVQMLAGGRALSEYRFGRRAIQHLFCSRCGVKVLGRGIGERGGAFYAVNLACLDDAEAELAAAPVEYQDGRHDAWQSAPAATEHL
jgi:hypothetical protein